jgi:general secretion pathway protein D
MTDGQSMRHLLATLLLVPVLASGQVPIRPPDRDRPASRPAPTPRPRPGSVTPASPTPTPPGAADEDDEDEDEKEETAAPAPQAMTRPAARSDRCVPLRGRFMLAFNKAEIVDVIEQASRWTCRNFIYTDEIARGKITLLSKTPVASDEAYAAFLAALSANNISVYPTGRFYKLIRTADAKKFPIPTYTGSGRTPGVEQPVTKVIRLQSADSDQLRGILGNFISPQGADIQSIPPDTLIITDIGLNLRRLERMIEAIDKAGAGDTVRLVQIRFASAKDVADKVNQIFTGSGGGGAAAATPSRTPRRATTAGQAATGGARTGDVQLTKVIPDERTNKVIVVADEKSFGRIQELIEQLDIPTTAEGGIHVVFLKNASAEDLAETLSNLAQGVATSRRPGSTTTGAGAPPGFQTPVTPGMAPTTPATNAPRRSAATAEILGDVKVTADKQQNALIIQASGSDFAAIQRLIEKLDRPRRQVFVEAVIMEVNLRDDTEFGVSAHGVVPVRYKGEDAGIPIASNPTNRFSSFNLQSIVGLGGFLTGFAGPVSAELRTLGINLPSLGVLVQALQSSSDVNVLSTPHLLASDNEESEISVGQNVPFQSGFVPQNLGNLLGTGQDSTSSALGGLLGTGGLSSFYAPIQRQNVELRLKIKPQISEGDNVRLTIEEQTEEIASNDATLGPTTSKRTVKTQIVAKDQSTIVMGGMMQERNVRSVRKVPLLGSLPIFGFLFRDTVTTKSKTNLLLFLTPYIIRDEADYRRIYEKKRKEYDVFVEQFYGRQPAYRVDVDFARKSGPYSKIRRGVAEEAQKLENGGPGTPDERLQVPPSSRPFDGAAQPPEDQAGEPEPEGEAPEAPVQDGAPEQPPPYQPPSPPGVVPGTEGAEPAPETPPPSQTPGGEPGER